LYTEATSLNIHSTTALDTGVKWNFRRIIVCQLFACQRKRTKFGDYFL